ncbi:MAG: hypothetical protein GY703_11980 [Gammaproteobacteria bacterium]|nr:hypothetical protein [Gammaproteobacteria bacterium]
MSTDKFFYFFMGLRKGEVRRRVTALRTRHPDESPTQLARRLNKAQIPLSFLGGTLLQAPLLVPYAGPVLKLMGVTGGTSVLMRMHLTLILEIAMAFGKDIDEKARMKEMIAVMTAAGLTSSASMLTRNLNFKPYYTLLAGGVTVAALSQLIGETAIAYYAMGSQAVSMEDSSAAATT